MEKITLGQLDALQRRLHYSFRDLNLLIKGLTHSSYINEKNAPDLKDNERFEFLGDSVLGLAISDYLVINLPDCNEGTLSKIRAGIVSENSLSRLSRELRIGECLYLGKGEEKSGGREKDSLLSNAFEAVIAAIYKDAGYEKTYGVLISLFEKEILNFSTSEFYKDYKSELQEHVQRKKLPLPEYSLLNEFGPDHNKRFEIKLTIEGKIEGTGTGRNKKEAEQIAAKEALQQLLSVE